MQLPAGGYGVLARERSRAPSQGAADHREAGGCFNVRAVRVNGMSRIDTTPTASRSPLGGGTRVWPSYGTLASQCVERSRQLQECAGTAALPRTCDGALRVGYIGEGAFPLREQRISASPMRRFSPPSFWASKRKGPPEGKPAFGRHKLPSAFMRPCQAPNCQVTSPSFASQMPPPLL